jgi:hypothetical protein
MLYIMTMIRTQVYLHKDQVQEIAFFARKQKKEKAKVIRSLIQKGIEAEKDKQTIGNALLELSELGKKLHLRGPKDLSTNLDTYLYEEK